MPSIFDVPGEASDDPPAAGIRETVRNFEVDESARQSRRASAMSAAEKAAPIAAQRIGRLISDAIGALDKCEYRPSDHEKAHLQGGRAIHFPDVHGWTPSPRANDSAKSLGRSWTLGVLPSLAGSNIVLAEDGTVGRAYINQQRRPQKPSRGRGQSKSSHKFSMAKYEADPYWGARACGVPDGELYWRVLDSAPSMRCPDPRRVVPLIYEGWEKKVDRINGFDRMDETRFIEQERRDPSRFAFAGRVEPALEPKCAELGFHCAVFEDGLPVLLAHWRDKGEEIWIAWDIEKFLIRRIPYVIGDIGRRQAT